MICPVCKARNIPEKSIFCNMCGVNLIEAEKAKQIELTIKCKDGIIPLADKTLTLGGQLKKIQVWCKDITKFDEEIDVLTISAHPYSYYPSPHSLIGALHRNLSIDISELAKEPLMDLRHNIGCWISKDMPGNSRIRRIGGVEIPLTNSNTHETNYESRLIKAFKSYMHLLDILSEYDTNIKNVVLPLLGTGDLHLDHNLLIFPLIGEVVQLLSRNKYIEKVIFVERSFEKAQLIADTINASYCIQTDNEIVTREEKNVFISYTEKGDRYAAEMLGRSLSKRRIPYWFAPKDVLSGDYATEIVKGIKSCTHFICIVSENSMKSTHVINEVALAFKRINEGIKIIPFHLDKSAIDPAFEYYLSRMNWKFNDPPPLERRIEELVNIII